MATFEERHDFKKAMSEMPYVTEEFMQLFEKEYGDKIEWAIEFSDLSDYDKDLLIKFYINRWSGKQLVDHLGVGVSGMINRRRDAIMAFTRWFWWTRTGHADTVWGMSPIDVLWVNPKTIKSLKHIAINTIDDLCAADFGVINSARDMSNCGYTELAIAVESIGRHLDSYDEWVRTGIFRLHNREKSLEVIPKNVRLYCLNNECIVEELLSKTIGQIAQIDGFTDDDLMWLLSHGRV